MSEDARYVRQSILPGVGVDGQARLGASRAVVIGVGALGCASADLLVRAGVGRVTLVDRDVVELSNLQRQTLFAESDVGTPKAVAAAGRLRAVNSGVEIEAVVADVTGRNVEGLIARAIGEGGPSPSGSKTRHLPLGGGVVVDGTDNFETRYLLNDVCVKHGVAFLYAGAVGTQGMIAAFVPGGACLRCVFEEVPEVGSQPTCETAGVLGPAVVVASAMQAAEAIKVLSGNVDAVSRDLVTFDLWNNTSRRIAMPAKRADCVCCGLRRFEFLEGSSGDQAVLCGREAVQVTPRVAGRVDLRELALRLAPHGTVTASEHLVRAAVGGVEITVFADGRAIVKGTTRAEVARGVYSKWIGG